MLRSLCARIVFVLILLALVLCAGARDCCVWASDSQETPAAEGEDQERDAVLVNAKSQYEAFRVRAGDITLRSVMTNEGPSVTTTATIVTYLKGEKARVETVVEYAANNTGGASLGAEPSETIFIRDKSDVWLVAPNAPKRKLRGQEADLYETEADWWKRIPDNAKISGEAEMGGRDCYVVSITMRKGEKPVKAWLDKDSLVFVGGEGPFHGKWMRWVNSDFRELEGRQIPYKKDYYSGDKVVGSLVVESVDAKAGLSDDLFDPAQLLGEQERAMEAFRRREQ